MKKGKFLWLTLLFFNLHLKEQNCEITIPGDHCEDPIKLDGDTYDPAPKDRLKAQSLKKQTTVSKSQRTEQ